MTAPVDGLAATKLRPPPLAGRLVHRPRLEALLDAGVEGPARLVLVSAPAGSGKSTLLAGWLAGRSGAGAWLQAESDDADPARFWSSFVQAITRAAPELPTNLPAVVAGSAGDDLVVVPALVNALVDLTGTLVAVVDDYHLVDSIAVHRGMERLIDLAPPQLRLVLASRMDPPFRLGRMRVRQQLVEIRGGDLRFAAQEAPALLGPSGDALDVAAVQALHARTEGWAAGLVLAGLSLQRTASTQEFVAGFAGDDSLVVEYLRDEFLAGLDAVDRQRMLQTSVLEQFDGALVDAVTGSTGGAEWLRRTAAANQLVIALDRTGTWFRYHHLLRDLLRLEADRALGDRVADLHARAADCFSEREEHGRAVEHYLRAGEAAAAAQLMLLHGPKLLRDGQVESLRGLLDRLGDLTGQLAWCALLRGWCEYLSGRYDSALTWIDRTLTIAPVGFDPVITTSLRINVSLGRGDVATALTDAVSVDVPGVLEAHNCDLAIAAGVAYAWAGRTQDARRVLRLAGRRAAAEHFPTAVVIAETYLAVVDLEEGVADARASATAALAAAIELGLGEYRGLAPSYAVRAVTGADPGAAVTDARHALDLVRRGATSLALAYVLTVAADALLERADPQGVQLLREARDVVDRCPDPGIVGARLSRTESRHHLAGATRDRAAVAGLIEPLTERELAVLRYLPTRLTQRDIAGELFVSLNTVKTHCQAAYRKLGVVDRKAAVQAARDLRLL